MRLINFLQKTTKFFIKTNVFPIQYKNTVNNVESNKIGTIYIELVTDIKYVSLFNTILNEESLKNKNIVFLSTRSFNSAIGTSFFAFLKRFNFVNIFYQSRFFKNSGIPKSSIIFLCKGVKNKSTYFKLKNVFNILKQLRNSKTAYYRNIKIDDLLIDSYIRFYKRPQYQSTSILLIPLIYHAIEIIDCAFSNLNRDGQLLVTYTSYIEHGCLVRVALEKGINVKCFGDLGLFAQDIFIDYPYHTSRSFEYKKTVNSIRDKKLYRKMSKDLLLSRFNGNLDKAIAYMKTSAYSKDNYFAEKKFNDCTIIFLHDFYDSPNIFPGFIFTDFYSWILFTVDLLIENKKKFYIKLHPNMTSDNIEVVNKLKSRYGEELFIDTPNNILINSNIKNAITVYGSVSHELAYHGIYSICCSNNPHMNFNFVINSKDISEYKKNILNFNFAKFQTFTIDDVLDFVWVHNRLYDKETFESSSFFTNLLYSNDVDEIATSICNLKLTKSYQLLIEEIKHGASN